MDSTPTGTPFVEPKMPLILWIILPFLVIFILIRRAAPSSSDDEREPPVAPSTIPVIGHAWGMLRHKGNYYKMISKRYASWPIFRLKVFSTNIYVISSPELSQSALCNTKSLSFLPLAWAFTKRVMRARQKVMDVVTENNGDNRYMNDMHRDTHAALALGPAIFESNARMLNGIAQHLNNIEVSGRSISLFDWIRNAYTVVTAETFYGKVNPVSENSNLVKLLWDYDEQSLRLLANIFPRFTAPKAWNARKIMEPAFVDYYDRGLDKNANGFIKARARVARAEGFTNQDMGSFDLPMLHTFLVNTVPNAFSMLTHIVSDPLLTHKIYEEVSSIAVRQTINDISRVLLDVSAINAKCPVLCSTFQENIRVCVNATSIRVVSEDMMLKDQYLLKKGGIVQVSGGYLHESPKYWTNPEQFDPYRFMKTNQSREEKKTQSQGWLPFGGGKHLCPGRHLAFVEIVGFLAMLVYGFEVRNKDGSIIKTAPYKKQQLGEASRKPQYDIDVVIRRKEEFKGATFGFILDTNAEVEAVSVL